MKNNAYRKNSYHQQDLLIFAKFTLLLSAIGFCACDMTASISETVNNNAVVQAAASPSPSPVRYEASREIDYKGIKFRNFIPSVSAIEVYEKPAASLQDITDKPDYVEPRNIVLAFRGEYGSIPIEVNYPPEIRIFSVDEFRQAYALSEEYMKGFDGALANLQDHISKTPVKREDFPGLHTYDAHQVILSRFKRLSFKNGKGIFYLTQYSQDCASIVNNQSLKGIFQGLTDNGKYYVTAAFPVALSGLPDSDLTTKFGDIDLSKNFYCSEIKSIKNKRYEKYLSSIEKLLNSTAAEKFNPDLNQIEKTIFSLEVNWRE